MCAKLGSALVSMAATYHRAARQSGASVHRARQALLNSSVLATESQDLRSDADSAGSEHEPITGPITAIFSSHRTHSLRQGQTSLLQDGRTGNSLDSICHDFKIGGGNYFFDNLMKKPTQKVGQVIDFIGRGERI